MKLDQIYVGGPLTLGQGHKAVAFFVPSSARKQPLALNLVQYLLSSEKGKVTDKAWALTDAGRLVVLTSTRVGKLSLKAHLEANGFQPASADNAAAQALADLLDVREGEKLAEAASVRWALSMRATHVDQMMSLVPFEPGKPAHQVTVRGDGSTGLTIAHLDTGLSLRGLAIHYTPSLGDAIDVSSGWLLHKDADAACAPRLREYGGLVEHAAWLLSNLGLVRLPQDPHLQPNSAPDAQFPRGELRLAVVDKFAATSDTLVVGIDAVDELVVCYLRAGQEIYRRNGLVGDKLSQVVGAIAAAMIRVSEMTPELPKGLLKPYWQAYSAEFQAKYPFEALLPLNNAEEQCVEAGLRAVLPALRERPGQLASDAVENAFGEVWLCARKQLQLDLPGEPDETARAVVRAALTAVAASPLLHA